MKLLSIAGLLLLATAACTTLGTGPRLPEQIVASRGGFVPEGVEYDTAGARFLVGSLTEGSVFEWHADGSLEPHVLDSELVSSVGIEIDASRDRLLVANSDDAVFGGEEPGSGKLGIYRLATGQRIAMVDLAAVARDEPDQATFVNDLTVDSAGNVYLTDTFMNVIYRVDARHEPTVFYRFEPTTGLGLNGIVYHADGYLIVVAIGGQGMLYRVPLADPSLAAPIALSQPAVGADGLVWSADGRLIVVSNSASQALAYRSDDGWNSASLVGVAAFEGQATTAAAVGDSIFVVQPHFNDAEPPVLLEATFSPPSR